MSGTAVRHTTATVLEAQRMVEAGWSAGKTGKMLGVSRETVRKWTDAKYAKAARERDATYKRRLTRFAGGFYGSRMRPETKAQLLVDLSEAGLRSTDVARAAFVLFRVRLSAEQVRYALQTDTVPRLLKRQGGVS